MAYSNRLVLFMKHTALTSVLFFASIVVLMGQCHITLPLVDDTICPLSINQAKLDSSFINQVEWDFCPAGLDSMPINIASTASFGNATRQLQVIYEKGNYYGFTVAPNIDGVQRIDFGNSLANPTTYNLVASGVMGTSNLTSVEVLRENNSIYLFVADNGQGKVFRLKLDSITDINPQVQLIPAGSISPFAIDIIGNFLFIANYNFSSISRLKFTYGFDSLPDILPTIATGGLPTDITMIYDCEKQKHLAAVVKLIGKEVSLLDFGNSFENIPTEKSIYSTSGDDYSIVSAHTMQGWYVFVSGTSGFLRGLKLTDNMDTVETLLFDSNFGGTVGQPIGMSYINAAGEPQLLLSHYSAGTISRFKFPDPCAVTPAGSHDAHTSFSIDTTLGQKVYFTANYVDSANLPQLMVDSFYTDYTNSKIEISFTNNCEGLLTQFNAIEKICLDTIKYRHWDFGDGTEDSLIANPVHAYATGGNYVIQYYFISTGGDSLYYSIPIEIKQKPVANFTFVNNQCANLNIPFTSTSVQGNDSIVNYSWLINGVPVGNDSVLNYTFTSGGQYTVTLQIANTVGCMDSITQVVSIADAPQAAFTATNTCIGGSVQFINGTDSNGLNVTYYWEFGDSFFSTDINPLHAYAGAGTDFQVMLIASGSNSCIDTLVQNVHLSVKPTPVISIVGNSFCQNQSYTFYENSFSNGTDSIFYTRWDMGNGDSFVSDDSLTYAYTIPGTYTITVTAATPTFCDSSATATIVVEAQPNVQFSAPDGCLGDTVYFINQTTFAQGDTIASYLWFLDYGGITATSIDTLFYYPTFSIYSVSLTAITDKGCVDTAYKSLFVYPRPVADYTFTTPVCTHFPVQFDNLSSSQFDTLTNYLWTFGDNNFSNDSLPTHIYTAPGQYSTSLLVTTKHNCKDTAYAQINVLKSPEPYFTFPSICQLEQVKFSSYDTSNHPFPIVSYLWSFGNNSTSPFPNPTALYALPGTYTVTLTTTDAQGCPAIASDTAVVNAKPYADFTYTQPCTNQSIMLYDASNYFTDSAGSILFYWNGTLAGGDSSIISLPQQGLNSVAMSISSNKGCVDSIFENVFINQSPQVSFSVFPTVGSIGQPISFNNQTSGASFYSWNFGDNTPVLNDEDASHVYNAIGSYLVQLTATSDSGCIDSASAQFTVVDVYLDIAVITLASSIRNNATKFSALLKNNSNIEVLDYKLKLDVEGLPSMIVDNKDPLTLVNPFYNFQFENEVLLSGNFNPEYFCVEVLSANGVKDEEPANDKLCAGLTDAFNVGMVYYNQSNVYADVYSLENESIEIAAYDHTGRMVFESSEQVLRGYNKLSLFNGFLASSYYTIKVVRENGSLLYQRFFVR